MARMINDVKVNCGYLEYKRQVLFIKRYVKIARIEALEKRMNINIKQYYNAEVVKVKRENVKKTNIKMSKTMRAGLIKKTDIMETANVMSDLVEPNLM